LQAADILAVDEHGQDMCLALADKVFGVKQRRGSKRAKDDTRIIGTLSPQVLFRVLASHLDCCLVIRHMPESVW
jgi:hypothetical protein